MDIILKQYKIRASREAVYKALTDPIEIEQWSGAPAQMVATEEGRFSLWGGSIEGVNTLVSNEHIVQNWKEKKWEKFSIVQFDLEEGDGFTILKMRHTDIPKTSMSDLDMGWDDYYLGPLKSYIER